MKIYYDLTEELPTDSLICGTCDTYMADSAELDTEAKTVTLTMVGCFGDTVLTLSLPEFLERYGDGYLWPASPFDALKNDIEELMDK